MCVYAYIHISSNKHLYIEIMNLCKVESRSLDTSGSNFASWKKIRNAKCKVESKTLDTGGLNFASKFGSYFEKGLIWDYTSRKRS